MRQMKLLKRMKMSETDDDEAQERAEGEAGRVRH